MKLKLKITAKILLWSFFLIIASTLIFYLFLFPLMEKQLVKTKENGLKNVVDSAVHICQYYDSLDNKQNLSEVDFLKWKQNQAMTTIKNMKYGKSGYLWINDFQPKMIMHPNFSQEQKPEWYKKNGLINFADPNGIKLFVEFVKVCESDGEGLVYYHWPKPGDPINKPSPKTSFVKAYNSWGWIIGSGVYTDDVKKCEMALLKKANLIILLTIIFLMTLAILFSFSFTKPLKKAMVFSNKIKEGNLTESLNIKTKDEIGQLGNALTAMATQLKNMIEKIKTVGNEILISKNNLTTIAKTVGDGTQNTTSSIEEISASLEELSGTVEQVAGQAQTQSADVEELTATVEELTSSVTNSAEKSESLKLQAQKSLEQVQLSETASSSAQEGMNNIAQSSSEIANIITVINDIADQTNLLALNASIEAARAGEAGRGFAVVAKEISNLADKSSSATKEIETLIKKTEKNVQLGVDKVQMLSKAIEKIKETIEITSQFSNEMSISTQEQLNGFNQIMKGVQNVNEVSQNVASSSEEEASATKEISQTVETINQTTQGLTGNSDELEKNAELLSTQLDTFSEMISIFKVD